MSSSPLSQKEQGYKASKEYREGEMAKVLYSDLRQFVLHVMIMPDDGIAMAMDKAFEIDRKALAIKALKQLTSELEGKK